MTNRRHLMTTRYLVALLLIAATLGAVLGALTATPAAATPPLCSSDADCAAAFGEGTPAAELDRYETAEGADPVAECLLAQGYTGRPDDGAETIYAPREAIEACASADDPAGMFVTAGSLERDVWAV